MENTYYTVITCHFNGTLVQKSPSTNPYISYRVSEGYVKDEFGAEHPAERKVFTYSEGCAEGLNIMHFSDTFTEENGRFKTEAEALEMLKSYKSWCRHSGDELDIAEAYAMYIDEEEPDHDEYIEFAPLTDDSETEFAL